MMSHVAYSEWAAENCGEGERGGSMLTTKVIVLYALFITLPATHVVVVEYVYSVLWCLALSGRSLNCNTCTRACCIQLRTDQC